MFYEHHNATTDLPSAAQELVCRRRDTGADAVLIDDGVRHVRGQSMHASANLVLVVLVPQLADLIPAQQLDPLKVQNSPEARQPRRR